MPIEQWLFDSWDVLLRTLIVGCISYATLIFFLRVAGKRTLARMNAFDMVVTVSLGSTLASVIVSNDVVLAQGALALALLIGLQYLISWSSVRVDWVRRLVTGEPTLLVWDGHFRSDALRTTRINRDDIFAAIRSKGIGSMCKVRAVVLETDGSFSVIAKTSDDPMVLVGFGGGAVDVDRNDAD